MYLLVTFEIKKESHIQCTGFKNRQTIIYNLKDNGHLIIGDSNESVNLKQELELNRRGKKAVVSQLVLSAFSLSISIFLLFQDASDSVNLTVLLYA